MTGHPLDPYTYILVDRSPVQHANDDAWWTWFSNLDNRRVACADMGSVMISTVFTGLDILQRGLLFETKILGGRYDGEEVCAATWEEAEKNHVKAIAKAVAPIWKGERP